MLEESARNSHSSFAMLSPSSDVYTQRVPHTNGPCEAILTLRVNLCAQYPSPVFRKGLWFPSMLVGDENITPVIKCLIFTVAAACRTSTEPA